MNRMFYKPIRDAPKSTGQLKVYLLIAVVLTGVVALMVYLTTRNRKKERFTSLDFRGMSYHQALKAIVDTESQKQLRTYKEPIYYGYLVTNGEDGYPSARQMRFYIDPKTYEITFDTYAGSQKINEMENNNKCSIILSFNPIDRHYYDINLKGKCMYVSTNEKGRLVYSIKIEEMILHQKYIEDGQSYGTVYRGNPLHVSSTFTYSHEYTSNRRFSVHDD